MSASRDTIPLARPDLIDADVLAAARALRSGRLVLGPENERFEAILAARTGRAFAICVTSGTTALELVLWALDLGAGDEVLVPAAGFPAAVNAALRVGASVRPVDIDPRTWNLDVAAIEAVGERARALVAIDLFGLVADSAALEECARRHGLILIDDAACSLGGHDRDGRVGGSYGVAGTLSFHPRKIITTGEGGAVVCDDEALAERLRQLRNQGQAGSGRFARAGTNARLPEASAAIGSSQLERLDAMRRERGLLAAGYRERLASLADAGTLSWQAVAPDENHAYQTFAVMLAPTRDRGRVIAALAARGVEAGVAAYSLTRLPRLWSASGDAAAPACPVAERLHDHGLALPLYIGMRSTELDQVCDALREVLA